MNGRLTSARDRVTGSVIQFDRTGQSGANAGRFLPGLPGAVMAGIATEKVTLKVQVHIIDTTTGTTAQSFECEKTQSGNVVGCRRLRSRLPGCGGGRYSNETFTNSTMAHLVNDEAMQIAGHLDPARFSSAPAPAAISGCVIATDSGGIIRNIGSDTGCRTACASTSSGSARSRTPTAARC